MADPYLELLARADTAIGELELLRREVQAEPGTSFVELQVDGRMLMSDYNSVSERALTHQGIARCRGEKLRVLVGGLGLGHTAHEALFSQRVAAVDVVEFVPQVIDWFERSLIPLAPKLRADPRLRVIRDDVFALLSRPATQLYDLILIDVDHAPDDPLAGESSAFYTVDGLRRVCQNLKSGGVLAVWSYKESREFEATLREVFSVVDAETTLFQDDFFGEPDEVNYLFFASS
jgi:spermidine synthase